jgi:rubrerythrin
MDVFKFAMQMEKDGERYYRNLCSKTKNEGLHAILTLLADAEVKHYKILKKMSEKAGKHILAEDTVFKDAKNIFQQIQEYKTGIDVSDESSYVGLYKEALDIESKSKSFYLEKADAVRGEGQKELFLQLAEEEKKHMILINTIIEFITRPDTWLENAEWYHLDEY